MAAPELKTFDDIMKFAVSKEEEAAQTYRNLAKNAKSGAKKLFEELARQEEGHKKKLLRIEVSSLPSGPASRVPDLRISEYLAGGEVKSDSPYQDVLIYAMKREEASVALYSDLAKVATADSARTLFTLLAEEERKHKLRLEKEYDDNVLKEN